MSAGSSVTNRREDVIGRVREAAGDALVERLLHLEAARGEKRPAPDAHSPPTAPEPVDALDADVIMAGGGLWLLLAPILAARGLRVIVVERATAGAAHREWNASRPELEALVSAGLVTQGELEALIVAQYRLGTCRFGSGGTYPVTGVLDNAVDAGALLGHARTLAATRGVQIVDGASVVSECANEHGVRVRVQHHNRIEDLTARVLVDARGVSSPYASADLMCPTVGGVLQGLAEGTSEKTIDPTCGEILATIDPIDPQSGRQHVWEAFPGRAGETTVYLFYYAHATEPSSLLELYGRFFDTLPDYKRGEARLIRPTFGYIPGWSRLRRAPSAPHRRIVLVGDAAARHSPLTYCGFGATLRSLARAADAVAALASGEIRPACVVDDAPIHALTGVLATMMATRKLRGDSLNALLDAAFLSLFEMGNDAYAGLLRDETSEQDFVGFLKRTAKKHPAVWRHVARVMRPSDLGRWSVGLARAMWAAP